MIPVYEEKDVLGKPIDPDELAAYVRSSTIANTPEAVKQFFRDYARNNAPLTDDVIAVLGIFASDDGLLAKTHVVNDGSDRQCVFLVRPDGVALTHDGGVYRDTYRSMTIDEALNYFRENAETVFLNMSGRTWAEVREAQRQLDAMMPASWDGED